MTNSCQIDGPFFDDHNMPKYNYVCMEPYDWICEFFSPSDGELRFCEFCEHHSEDDRCTCDEAIKEAIVEEVMEEI